MRRIVIPMMKITARSKISHRLAKADGPAVTFGLASLSLLFHVVYNDG
jgi:hypothetical protein